VSNHRLCTLPAGRRLQIACVAQRARAVMADTRPVEMRAHGGPHVTEVSAKKMLSSSFESVAGGATRIRCSCTWPRTLTGMRLRPSEAVARAAAAEAGKAMVAVPVMQALHRRTSALQKKRPPRKTGMAAAAATQTTEAAAAAEAATPPKQSGSAGGLHRLAGRRAAPGAAATAQQKGTWLPPLQPRKPGRQAIRRCRCVGAGLPAHMQQRLHTLGFLHRLAAQPSQAAPEQASESERAASCKQGRAEVWCAWPCLALPESHMKYMHCRPGRARRAV